MSCPRTGFKPVPLGPESSGKGTSHFAPSLPGKHFHYPALLHGEQTMSELSSKISHHICTHLNPPPPPYCVKKAVKSEFWEKRMSLIRHFSV